MVSQGQDLDFRRFILLEPVSTFDCHVHGLMSWDFHVYDLLKLLLYSCIVISHRVVATNYWLLECIFLLCLGHLCFPDFYILSLVSLTLVAIIFFCPFMKSYALCYVLVSLAICQSCLRIFLSTFSERLCAKGE